MPTISGFTVVIADRVKETTGTSGTGTYSLNGAVSGFRTFVAGIGSGNRCPYVVQLGTQWEVAVGTATAGAPATLSRDLILASSSGGSAVNWASSDPKDIYLDLVAALATQISADVVASVKRTQFTSNGTFTRDAKCLFARVRMVGGGGGGGASPSVAGGSGADAGGGGGGEHAEGQFTSAQIGASVAVTIGPGGAGGTTGPATNGSAGGTTSFGALLTAGGGSGGVAGIETSGSSDAAGGAGGTGGSGTGLRSRGDDGGLGRVTQGAVHATGFGGGSVFGGIRQAPVDANGNAGRLYGGGGSGASTSTGGSAHTGGPGAAGIVIVEEFLRP